MAAAADADETASNDTSADSFAVTRRPARLKRKASLLLLVVIAVWCVDVVFALDSVVAKVSSIPDPFVNCSSSAFAMLSLRSMYFIMEALTDTFQMLKYGIAAVLILTGMKLIFAPIVYLPAGVCFALIAAIIVASAASSYWMPLVRGTMDMVTGDEDVGEDFGDIGAQGGASRQAPSSAMTSLIRGSNTGSDQHELESGSAETPYGDSPDTNLVPGHLQHEQAPDPSFKTQALDESIME